MFTKCRRECLNAAVYLSLIAFAVIAFSSGIVSAAYNYEHVNVTTRVNITNAFPEILNVTVDGSVGNVILTAGGARTVVCNATIRDFNGFNDIVGVNATFYYYLNQSGHQDDRNEHYTNTSCAPISNDGQYRVNYTCTFPVYYFAYNGTWNCNVTVIDNYNFTDAENRSTVISPLYALNVTDVIDYGNLSVTDYSDNITATVTNFGNRAINISVLGYGLVEGDGVGLVCGLGTNISVSNQRFSSVPTDWALKTQLLSTNRDVNATVQRQTDDLVQVTQTTYWQLYVPPNPFGTCTGKVRFTATIP